MARWPLAYTALGRGSLAEARVHLAAATSFAAESRALDLTLPALWGSAEVSVLAGDDQAAIDQTEAALEIAGRTGDCASFAQFAVTGTRARLAGARPADAARWLERSAALLEPVEWLARPALSHARGLVALSDGSIGVARSSLERAIRGWTSCGRLWEGQWARLDLSGCLIRSGRFVDATALIADVRETAQRLDSRPLLDRADALGRLARGHGAERVPWHPLTARELEVARLISTGRTNSASAHVEHILAKLGAGRRTEIASWVATVSRDQRRRDARFETASMETRVP
jgi:DNA-binding CsgD family transcriptional regulator